ncbi:MAG: ATP-binding protein [Saprospiraceae bacterium]|nr:ATP-binding protein [Saprospiraceae bacterium]
MIPKEIDDIKLSDIEIIFKENDRELRTLEFKREITLSNSKEKKEFLADISSFANSVGGDIILGIDEKLGVKPIEIDDIDSFLLRIESIIRTGIEPKIGNCRIKEIKVEENKYVLIIRIPKSYISPHRVTFESHDKFYGRGENGKYPLDVYQLRNSFLSSENAKNRINDFLQDRINKIISSETPLKLPKGARLMLHIIPIESFGNPKEYDLMEIIRDKYGIKISPIDSNGRYGQRINFDGIVSYRSDGSDFTSSYLQIFRKGIIEAVNSSIFSASVQDKLIPSTYLEKELIYFIGNIFDVIKKLKFKPPFFLILNIIDIKDFKLATGGRGDAFENYRLERNILSFNEIFIEDYPESPVKLLRIWFDHIWQAFGYEGCGNYRNYKNELSWTDGSATYI